MTQNDEDSKGYINVWAAKALQVRVYMTKGDWNNALAVAEDIINNAPYSLWNTSEYASAWSEGSASHAKEILFELVIDDTTDWTDREGIAYLYSGVAGVGYGDVVVTKAFSDMLTSDPQDVRNNILLEPLDPESVYAGNKVYINKMPVVAGDPRYADVPVLRLSEVYLSAAEAAFQAGDLNKAPAC